MKKLLLSALFIFALASNSFAGFIYDAKTDFNTLNPNGVWSYGYSDNQTSSVLTSGFNAVSGFATGFAVNADFTPGVWKVNQNLFGFNAGDFVVHPGRVGNVEQYGVIRFTAPTAGVYDLALNWVRKGTSASPINVFAFRSTDPGSPFVNQNYNQFQAGSFSQNGLNLALGETIDLRVGGAGQSNGDGTVVGFTVTAVPEPSALACISGLVAGLSVLSRRRRQG